MGRPKQSGCRPVQRDCLLAAALADTPFAPSLIHPDPFIAPLEVPQHRPGPHHLPATIQAILVILVQLQPASLAWFEGPLAILVIISAASSSREAI